MRVLFVSREYPPSPAGGIGSYVASMAASLAARGHDVHVLSCWGTQDIRDYVDRGVHIHRRKERTIRGLWRVRRWARKTVTAFLAGLSTYSAFRELQLPFDVVEYPDIVAEGWVFGLVRPKPLVAHVHSPLDLYCKVNDMPSTVDIRLTSLLERFAVRRAHVATTPSHLMMKELKAMGWLPHLRPRVIPHPIKSADRSEGQSIEETDPTILFMNRLERNKAPEILVQAMASVRKVVPGAKALFVGSGGKRNNGMPYLQWLRESFPDLTSCEFIDEVSRDALRNYLSASRVVVIPSWFESFSMSAVEAMAAGRPVVVTRTTGVSELVGQTGGGTVIPPGDSHALAEAVLPFLLDVSHAKKAGQSGKSAVRQYLAPETIAIQRESAYQQAIDIFQGKALDSAVCVPGHLAQ